MKALVAIFTVLLLAGCMGKTKWMHATASQQDFNKARYGCVQGASFVVPGTIYVPPPRQANPSPAGAFAQGLADGAAFGASQGGMVQDERLFVACMQAQGYWLESAN